MTEQTIRIATRKSPLAMWQAEHVAAALQTAHADVTVELVGMSTEGDRVLDSPLAKIGGKGLFVKELEIALLENRADIAVHSMKDVPVELPDELHIPCILAREEPFDAFVSNTHPGFKALPQGATLGTSSLRRQAQLRALRPDLNIIDLRGNVNTRLAKLDAGDYDAIILAAAGLVRLGMADRIRERLPASICLPAVGQGAIGIECRTEDPAIEDRLHALHHAPTAARVAAERALNARLAGGCQVPIAGFAEIEAGQLHLRALVGATDGSKIIRAQRRGNSDAPDVIGIQAGEDLLDLGAGALLAQAGIEVP